MITKKDLKMEYKEILTVDSARLGVRLKTKELMEADNLDNMALFIDHVNRWSRRYSNKETRGNIIDELNRVSEGEWKYYKILAHVYYFANELKL